MARISGRGVKYWPAPDLVSCAFFFEQPLVGIALHVGAHRRPIFGVDQVHNHPPQLDRVLELVLGLAENQPQHALLGPELFQQVAVVVEQLIAILSR